MQEVTKALKWARGASDRQSRTIGHWLITGLKRGGSECDHTPRRAALDLMYT